MMKNLTRILLLLAVVATLCKGCNNIGDNELSVTYPEDVDMSDVSLSGTTCSWNWQNTEEDTVYVINSAEELVSYISCEKGDAPAINFDSYSLLLAHGVTTSGVHEIERNLQQTSTNKYKLIVDITLEMTTVAQGWALSALVPKIPNNAIIKLDVIKHH